jgi:hypothetical protein
MTWKQQAKDDAKQAKIDAKQRSLVVSECLLVSGLPQTTFSRSGVFFVSSVCDDTPHQPCLRMAGASSSTHSSVCVCFIPPKMFAFFKVLLATFCERCLFFFSSRMQICSTSVYQCMSCDFHSVAHRQPNIATIS